MEELRREQGRGRDIKENKQKEEEKIEEEEERRWKIVETEQRGKRELKKE